MKGMRGFAVAIVAAVLAAGPARAEVVAEDDSVEFGERASEPGARALADRLEGIQEQVQALTTDVDRLRRIKLSGYVQARWETAENKSDSVRVTGSPAVITPANNERFYVRRGRIKLTYDAGPRSQGVVYFDGASSGSSINVRLLEATVTVFDPWTPERRHAATIGQMNVPFGFELERSSSARELPERSRAENVLFPGERDRGVKVVSQWTARLETVVGLFNGGGIGDPTFPTADPTRAKDAVMRVRYAQGSVDGAISWLTGRALTPLTGPDIESDRTRLGADVQAYYQMPRAGGGTVRGECYLGHEVNPDSVKALTMAPGGSATGTVARPGADPDHFATDFTGFYAMWVQNLGEKLQFAGRYDYFDPNDTVDHDQYERWSLGLNAYVDGHTRVTVSYDIPRTERLIAGRWVDPDDNLWTVQVQLRY